MQWTLTKTNGSQRLGVCCRIPGGRLVRSTCSCSLVPCDPINVTAVLARKFYPWCLLQVEAQNQVVRRLEEKEQAVHTHQMLMEKEIGMRTQAFEMHKRKVSRTLPDVSLVLKLFYKKKINLCLRRSNCLKCAKIKDEISRSLENVLPARRSPSVKKWRRLKRSIIS